MWLISCVVAVVVLAAPALADPVTVPTVDRARRAETARAIAAERGARGVVSLTKAELRAPMHQLVPLLAVCYRRAQARDARISGVINTRFSVESDPRHGMILTVLGFDTAGPLGQSSEFCDCISATVAAIVLPPLTRRGSADITYPITFAPQPPDHRGTALVAQARQATAAGHWDEALTAAEQGLELTSLDGPIRRHLIAQAGVAACRLGQQARARHYYSLASSTYEPEIREACARHPRIALPR